MTAPTATKDKESADPPAASKSKILFPGTAMLLVAVIGCFTAWGIAADLTTPMVSGF